MGFNPEAFDQDAFDPNAFDFGVSVIGPVFLGPPIGDLIFIDDVAISPIDFSSLFSGGTTYAAVGTLPTGLTLSSAGVLSGTPTTEGVSSGLRIRATNDDGSTDSNTFAITIIAAPSGGAGLRRTGFGFGMG